MKLHCITIQWSAGRRLTSSTVQRMSRISRDLAAHHLYSKANSTSRGISSQRCAGQKKMPHVAIIGAGFAGLRCADVLLQNGVRVTTYEARHRVGGRVHQHSVGGHMYDMGPNWIHGTEGNPIMDLARKTGGVIMEPEERQMVFDSDGNEKSPVESAELGAEAWAMIVQAFKYSNDHCAEIDPDRSLMDYFRDEVPKKFPGDKTKTDDLLNEARMWGPFIGEPVDRQSLRNFFLEECLEGENVFLASTYHDILNEVATKAQQEAEIRLNEEVTKIEYRNEGDHNSLVSVTTSDGKCDEFDEVVVTCPLGWLKRHKDQTFSPKLPPRLSSAIENVSYGHLEKIYVTFPSAWWMNGPASSNSSQPTTSTSSSSAGDSSTSSPQPIPTYLATDDNVDTNDQQTPIFIHFHHPRYHPDPSSKQNEFWNQSIVSMAHFPNPTAQPTLLFYIYGPCSQHVTSLIKDMTPHSPSYNTTLHNFVQPFVSRLPGYDPADASCTPTTYLATQWSNDPLAGHGSYSNFQTGLVQGDDDVLTMRRAGGLGDAGRGLWFAGEHTAPFVALGTTTGAYWSGDHIARRVLERCGVVNVVDESVAAANGVGGGEERGGNEAVRVEGDGDGVRKHLSEDRVGDGANLSGLAI